VERIITKRHIFNFEMKYRPWLAQFSASGVNDDTVFTLELLDFIISRNYFDLECYNDAVVFEFIDDYKDIIDWHLLLTRNKYLVDFYLSRIKVEYNEYFDDKCFKFINTLDEMQNFMNKNISKMFEVFPTKE